MVVGYTDSVKKRGEGGGGRAGGISPTQRHFILPSLYGAWENRKKLQRKFIIIINLHITQARFMRQVCGNYMKAAVNDSPI